MGYADVTDLHAPLVERFTAQGYPWPVLYGFKSRWEQRNNKALVGGDVVVYAGDATGSLGGIEFTGEQVFKASPSFGGWAQLLGVQVNARADVPADTSASDRMKADDKLAICIVNAVLSELQYIATWGAPDGAGGHPWTPVQDPTFVARSRQQNFGVSIELVAAIEFSIRGNDRRQLVNNLTVLPAATALSDEQGTEQIPIVDQHTA